MQTAIMPAWNQAGLNPGPEYLLAHIRVSQASIIVS
jgi:hypothetical protein